MKTLWALGLVLTLLFSAGLSARGQDAVSNTAPPAPNPGPVAPGPVPPGQTNGLKDYLSSHISYYEPIYFIMGTAPSVEFQFSLKYQIFTFDKGMARGLNYLFFAYTQTSFWNLLTNDPAFYDTSYKPSGFLYWTNATGASESNLFHLALQGGYEHESNGRGGTDERSMNRLYFQPTFVLGRSAGWEYTIQPRAWIYTGVGTHNRDIARYRGYASVLASVSTGQTRKWGGMDLMATLLIGNEGSHAGVKVDYFFNLPPFLGFNPALQAEYFNGYGQTLLQYNAYSHGVRGGLCLWY
jgi:outer membrane phospholipase A